MTMIDQHDSGFRAKESSCIGRLSAIYRSSVDSWLTATRHLEGSESYAVYDPYNHNLGDRFMSCIRGIVTIIGLLAYISAGRSITFRAP